MYMSPECFVCFQRQALDVARMGGIPIGQQTPLLMEVAALLLNTNSTMTQAELADEMHRMLRERVGMHDPYMEAKDACTYEALSHYDELHAMLVRADDPLRVGTRLAIAGNIMDLGVSMVYDLKATVQRVLAGPLAIDDLELLRDALKQARSLLYLADNAGETVFDRLFIEALNGLINVPVRYVVKASPALNDATRRDAELAGVDQVADVIDSGSNMLGTQIDRSPEEFRALYAGADLIIAKGMANYETLFETGDPRVFFLMPVKCEAVARLAGAPVGSLLLVRGDHAIKQP